MSAAARWSYTAPATLWPLLALDGWSGGPQFGAPVAFQCDYKAEARTVKDGRGREFTVRQTLYTERADIKQGDRVLIGTSASVDPIAVGAVEVLHVGRYGDTFDRTADDFEVMT